MSHLSRPIAPDSPARPWRRRLPFVAVSLVVLLAGFDPQQPLPELFRQQDKLHHLLGFAALLFTARVAFPRVRGIWLVAASLAAALAIEAAQAYLPQRTASLGDMLANTLGVLLGWACARLAQRLRPVAFT